MENYGKPDRSCRIQGDAIIARAMDINAGPAEQRRSGDWGRCARAAQKSEARLKIGSGYNRDDHQARSEEHTSELQSLMRISYAVFCLKKKNKTYKQTTQYNNY